MIKLIISQVFLYCAYAAKVEESVIHCTDADFEDTVKSGSISLVKFYAPWCGHCKKMAPEFIKAAQALESNDPPVQLIKVDCTTEKTVCSKYDVKGYPTVKIFRGLEHEEYKGGRTAPEMIAAMKAKAGPSSKDLDTVDAAEKYFAKNTEVNIVGYFSSATSDLAKAHKKAAEALSTEFSFAHSTSDDVNAKYGRTDVIVLHRPVALTSKLEPSEVVFEGKATVGDLKTFINKNALGLCGHRTEASMEKYDNPLVIAYYGVDYVRNPKGTNYYRNRVMKVAKKIQADNPDITFAVSNADDFEQEIAQFGIDKADKQPHVGMFDAKGQKFAMKGDFGMDTLEKFVNDVVAGNLEPFLKSEDIPEEDDEGVKVVVAKNFDEIVNDPTKDVLIEFYAPWCGHCKSLAPKYAELAQKLADEPDIVIAKMDATANDVPQPYDVKGFPTIFFAPKNGKSSPKSYNGEREVDGFMKYLAKEATDELKGFNRKGKKRSKKTEL